MIVGICSTCGFVYSLQSGKPCPACMALRIERVRETFKPIDMLRTALGVSGQRPKDAEEWSRMREEIQWGYYRPSLWDSIDKAEAEVPKGCKMPQDDAAQIYELKRRFRL